VTGRLFRAKTAPRSLFAPTYSYIERVNFVYRVFSVMSIAFGEIAKKLTKEAAHGIGLQVGVSPPVRRHPGPPCSSAMVLPRNLPCCHQAKLVFWKCRSRILHSLRRLYYQNPVFAVSTIGGWRCQAASLTLGVMNATVHNPPPLAPPTLMPDHLSNCAGPIKQQLCCPGLEAPR
jgi:hypothetical protein